MKSNILTTLLIILLGFPSHAGWFDSSVSSDEIINQNGLAYLKKSSEIYSGTVEDKYENGQTSFKGEYKKGLKVDEFQTFFINGQLKKSINYVKGIEDGEVLEFYEDGSIKTSYIMKNGKISDGLFKVFDNKGFVEKLEYYLNQEPQDKYESHSLIEISSRKNIDEEIWFDDNNVLKDMTFISSKTGNPFTGEYIKINYKKDGDTLIYNFKNGKLNGKGSEFNYLRKRTYRGSMKNGKDDGFFEWTEFDNTGSPKTIETGYFKQNKRHGVWILKQKEKRIKQIWKNGTKQRFDEDWEKFLQIELVRWGEIDSANIYMNLKTNRRNGEFIYFWILLDIPEKKDSTVLLYQGNCDKFNFRLLFEEIYGQPMGQNYVRRIFVNSHDHWLNANGNMNKILKHACLN